MKRLAAVLTIVGATLGVAAPAAMASTGSVCVHLDVNGTVVDKCLSQ